MTGIPITAVPAHLDGPAVTAAASALMLMPANAPRHIRLHRLAALGMAAADSGARPASPSAVRSMLKRQEIGGEDILAMEDPFSEPLVGAVTFFGGSYLVSGGSAEHAIADLENFIDACFREPWLPAEVHGPARMLIRGLLCVSDIVLSRAGLVRGTAAEGTARSAMQVPGAVRLNELTAATFLSNDDLDARGDWLRMVVDTFALDPGQLTDPCAQDLTDDRLHLTPFLRLANGYRVVLPLDLAITIRFHLMRFVSQEGLLAELGERSREVAMRRVVRVLHPEAPPVEVERSPLLARYLIPIDSRRDLHLVMATDPLSVWESQVWGTYDTRPVLDRLAELMAPETRESYSTAEELLHLVITDSPGRAAFWGVPNVEGADPVLIARSDDVEVIAHHERDASLGLLLFAQAIVRREGGSMSMDILDEFTIYEESKKSFYLSDGPPANFWVFQVGEGLAARLKFQQETDRHGVQLPGAGSPIVEVQRRYGRDAPEIYATLPNRTHIGCLVEYPKQSVFVHVDLGAEVFVGAEMDVLDCVAFWVRECFEAGAVPRSTSVDLVVSLGRPEAWTRSTSAPDDVPEVLIERAADTWRVELAEGFVARLRASTNEAERGLVHALLTNLFEVGTDQLEAFLDAVAPMGPKRMITVFSQDQSPDVLAENLPEALTGHAQVDAQLLDQLGEWLRDPSGGGFSTGPFDSEDRVAVLNSAVGLLFEDLERQVSLYEPHALLGFLIAQNESLLHHARMTAMLLKSRLACFGQQSETVAEIVEDRRAVSNAHRANRFLIEYLAAQPPNGSRTMTALDYLRVLAVAREIVERATTSDFLHYGLADFEVSILESGRLGVNREEPVVRAIDKYASQSGVRTVREALKPVQSGIATQSDDVDFVGRSEMAMRAEFGFSLVELRDVCGGLLDHAIADRVTRVPKATIVDEISNSRGLSHNVVLNVLERITLQPRSSFLGIGKDAWPWRFSRDKSFVRRPIVLQGDELVYGFRTVYRLGVFWMDSLLSGRFQGQASTVEMRQFISEARGAVNAEFALSVAARLQDLGMSTRIGVKKIGKQRIADAQQNDLGDIDVLAVHQPSKLLLAVEAKDFEIARTPGEIANEVEKLLEGSKKKQSTVALHKRRVAWLQSHVDEAIASFGIESEAAGWDVRGIIVTSDPLITPLLANTPLAVVAFDDLDEAALGFPLRDSH